MFCKQLIEKRRLIVLIFIFVAGNVFAECPNGDLDNDCYVGIADLAIFASQWLDPAGCIARSDDCGDLMGSNGVNLQDFAAIASNWRVSKPHLSINEFMASNNTILADGQGGFDDWIEIYNDGDVAIDMEGMYLTDDLANPSKWMIPTSSPGPTTIAAKGYLLIWADSEAGSGLHAPFKLSAGGDEDVALFDTVANGQGLIDSISFGSQETDISYGRYTDGTNNIRFFSTPTPLTANSGAYIDAVADTSFNYKRGFYSTPISVTISSDTPGATIRYTTDGSEPTESSTIYTAAIPVSSTTCLRAKAYKAGWMETNIDTQTYIYVSDVINQSPTGGAPGPGWPTSNVNGQIINYGMDPDVINDVRYSALVDDALLAIPSISLVTDLDNLFDPSIGIYVNAMQDTIAWERPVSMELINPDGTEGFQIDAGIRIRGGWSREDANPKHAFRFFFRSKYGDPKLLYPLFGNEGTDEFEKIDLRTSQNYSWSYVQAVIDGKKMCTMNRDVFSRDLQREMEQPYTRSRYYHLYINGHYWGLFQTQERSEARYAETYLGGDSANYDVIKINGGQGNPYTIEATDGDLLAYNELYDLAMAGFSSNADYYYVQGLNPDGSRNPAYKKYVEIDNLIDYIIVNLYTGNKDSINNNWYILRDRLGDEGFRFFAHDSEWTLLDVNEDQTWVGCNSEFQNFHIRCLHSRLTDNAEYRLRFADRVHKHLANGGILTPSNAENLFMDRANEIDMAIIAESARWGDSKVSTPRTKDDDWLPAINNIVNNYFPYRTDIVLAQLKNRGWYPAIDSPVFYINGSYKHGGYISAGDNLSMINSNGSGTIYYTLDGSDPRLPGGGINPAAIAYGGSAPQSTVVTSGSTWHFLDDGSDQGTAWKEYAFDHESLWAKTGPARLGYGDPAVTAIDYGPDSGNKYITTYLRHTFSISDASIVTDLTLDVIRDDGVVIYLNGNEYGRSNMPAGPVDYLTVSGPWVDGAAETTFFEITKDSAAVSWLVDGDNVLAVELHQSSGTSSDLGFDLQLTATEESLPGGPVILNQTTMVKARGLDGSEWTALNNASFGIGPVAQSLRITEIMYNPVGDPNSEFIELENIGGAPVNLKLASFTEGIDFTFGNQILTAGDYVVVVRNLAAFNTAHPGFDGTIAGVYNGSLDNSGEPVRLEDAVGTPILDFNYKDGWYGITDGGGFSLTLLDSSNADLTSWSDKDSWASSTGLGGTPGQADTGPKPGDIVINEVLAHSDTIAYDWIELYNTTTSPINIGGWFLSDTNSDDPNLMKYEIAAGQTIGGYGYKVFYENLHFGSASSDPGRHIPFALSENGETVCLTLADSGVLGGYREKEDFGASLGDVSLGRYIKSAASGYDVDFVAMNTRTNGSANSSPKVGPIVISEIMYHPSDPDSNAEYVELVNISGSPLTLFDDITNEPWKFVDDYKDATPGLEYYFPAGTPVAMAAGERILLVKDITAYTAKFGVPSVQTFAWNVGSLANAGERLQLSMPGDLNGQGVRQYIRVDRVNFSDGSHPEDYPDLPGDPWPTSPDGLGDSLDRKSESSYGNDVVNWQGATPSPGIPSPGS